jgi:hypothetical protein
MCCCPPTRCRCRKTREVYSMIIRGTVRNTYRCTSTGKGAGTIPELYYIRCFIQFYLKTSGTRRTRSPSRRRLHVCVLYCEYSVWKRSCSHIKSVGTRTINVKPKCLQTTGTGNISRRIHKRTHRTAIGQRYKTMVVNRYLSIRCATISKREPYRYILNRLIQSRTSDAPRWCSRNCCSYAGNIRVCPG